MKRGHWRGLGVETSLSRSQQPITLVGSLGGPWTGPKRGRPGVGWKQALVGPNPSLGGARLASRPEVWKESSTSWILTRGRHDTRGWMQQTDTGRDPASAQGEVKPSQRVTRHSGQAAPQPAGAGPGPGGAAFSQGSIVIFRNRLHSRVLLATLEGFLSGFRT